MIYESFPHPNNIREHRVKVLDSEYEHTMWSWCSNTFKTETWGQVIALVSNNVTFCFDNKADALLFLLKYKK